MSDATDVTIALYFRTVWHLVRSSANLWNRHSLSSFFLVGNYFTVHPHHHYLKVTEISVQKPKEDSRSSVLCVAVAATPGILDEPRGPCETHEVAWALWPLDKAHALIRGYTRSTVRGPWQLLFLLPVFLLLRNRSSRPRPTERSNPPGNLWLTF